MKPITKSWLLVVLGFLFYTSFMVLSYSTDSPFNPVLYGKHSMIFLDAIHEGWDCVHSNTYTLKYSPHGIISKWYYDLTDDGIFYSPEDLFYKAFVSKKRFGNNINIAYYPSCCLKDMNQRCQVSKILNYSENNIWYSMGNDRFDILINYKYNKEEEYLLKTIKIIPKKTTFFSYLTDNFDFSYQGHNKNKILDFKYIKINNHIINIPDVAKKGKEYINIYPLINTSVLLFKENPVDNSNQNLGTTVFFSTLCKSNINNGDVILSIPRLYVQTDYNVYILSLSQKLLDHVTISPGHNITATFIYFYRKNSTNLEEYISNILKKEGCWSFRPSPTESKEKEIIIYHYLPLYDNYSLEGLTLSHALGLKYITSLPKDRPFYYIENANLNTLYNGIKINKDLLIKIAKKNNITTYSSCDNTQSKIFVGSIAYHKRGIYISNYKDADIYLCGDEAREQYIKIFNNTIYGMSIIPSDLYWKYLSIVYANKSYPLVITQPPSKEEIKNTLSYLLRKGINHNIYFKLNGLFILLFGDENILPFKIIDNTPSDAYYGNITSNKFIDFAIGRVVYPLFPKNHFYLRNAIVMSDYEQPSKIAFLNYYNGMFTSLMAKKWLTREKVQTSRYVERRANISKLSNEQYDTLKNVLVSIASHKAVASSSIVSAIYLIYSVATDVMEIVHEINYNKIDKNMMSLTYFISHPDIFEKNLAEDAFLNIDKTDFFGYFGKIKDNRFVYPNVSINNIPLFTGFYYLDYDNTYEEGKELSKEGAFGVVLLNKKQSRLAQERFGHFMRYLLVYNENIGNALKDSANIILAKKRILEKIGVESTSLEAYGRVFLGDPSIKVYTPLHSPPPNENNKKTNQRVNSQRHNYILDSKDINIPNQTEGVVYSKVYPLNNMTENINESFLKENNVSIEELIYSDVITLPSLKKYHLSYTINKEFISNDKNLINKYSKLKCQVYNNSINTVNGKTQVFVLIPFLCQNESSLYRIKQVSLSFRYIPTLDIINAKPLGNKIHLKVYSSQDKEGIALNIYSIERDTTQTTTLSLKKGLNDIYIDKNSLHLTKGNYYLVIGNVSYYLNMSSYPLLYITEVYPNPPDERLEFVEFYYNDTPLINAQIVLDEGKNHTITLNLSRGYYVLTKNKTLLMEELDIPQNQTQHIIEVRGIRLNNKGENVKIYYHNNLLDNVSYVSSSCVSQEICSIHYSNGSYEDIPTPLYESKKKEKEKGKIQTPKEEVEVKLINTKIFKGGEIKVKIKKKTCEKEEMKINYSIEGYKGSIKQEFLCSKTIYVPVSKYLDSGNHSLYLSISFNNQTYEYLFPFSILDRNTLKCNLSLNVQPYNFKADENKEITYRITLYDNLCQGITHPVRVRYGVKDYKNNTLYEKEGVYEITCYMDLKRQIKLTPSLVSKIRHPLLEVYAIIEDSYCNNSNNISEDKEDIVYVGDIKQIKDIDSHTPAKVVEHSKASSSKHSSSITTSTAFVAQPVRNIDKDIKIDTIILKGDKIYVIVNNTKRAWMNIYAYLYDGKRLLSYYCNNDSVKKGWKANVVYTNASQIILKLCVKDQANITNSKIKVKYSFDNKTYKEIVKQIPSIYSNFLSYHSSSSEEHTKITNHNTSNTSYSYKCFIYNNKIGVDVIPSNAVNITISTNKKNNSFTLSHERIFLLNEREKMYINSKEINCSYLRNTEIKSQKDVSIIKRILNKLFSILASLV